MIAHCLFEQSGTFKNEFKKLGYEAYDYDIQNEFGETDYVIDLFAEIEGGYQDKPSIFDNISQDDLILAFFPCTYFSDQGLRHLVCSAYQYKNFSISEKCDAAIERHNEINKYYVLLNKLVAIADKKKLKMVIENPYSTNGLHYLRNFWFLKPALIDKDRTNNGDYYKKPTQYFFLNIEPKFNLVFEPLEEAETFRIRKINNNTVDGLSRATMRSMIHPQYANRFIRQHLIDYEQKF